MNGLHELAAIDIAQLIKDKKVSAVEVTRACLERIDAREKQIHAWQYVDYEGALTAAKRADNSPHQEGLLRGVPVALKDIINTAHLATTYGSKAFAQHRPTQDADCVSLLQEHGAIIVGKTVTTEFAFFAPGPTTNPHNTAHTPGGSSSGSAAAVADFHVPLALGTQTAGSIIRPASFNGILGYKPSYNSYSKNGVHPLAPSLDTLGSFARRVDDLNLLNQVLGAETRPTQLPIKKPKNIVIVRTPYWDQASPDMRSTFDSFVRAIADVDIEIVEASDEIDELNADFELLSECQLLLMALEAKEILAPIAEKYGDLIRPETKSLIEQGLQAPSDAEQKIEHAKTRSAKLMLNLASAADLVLTPSALGAAPVGISATGDPIFNRAWTFSKAPCLNIPVGRDANKLPIGVQFVSAGNNDDALLSHAQFLISLSHYQMSPPQ